MSKDILAQIKGVLDKRFGKGTAASLHEDGGSRSEVTEVIPTGLAVVDHYVIGVGGLPVGKMVEVFGEESSGKSSFALGACAGVTREGGIAIYADAEHSIQRERAQVFGIDFDRLLFLQPDTIEEAIDQMSQALDSIPAGVGPNIVVLDSIAASVPKAELEGEAGDAIMGLHPRMVGRLCRALLSRIAHKRACLLLVNQTREKIGVVFGNPMVTPGGKAPKFFSAVRLHLTQGAKPEKDHRDVKIRAVKNKLSMPFKEAIVRLDYAKGWDDSWSTVWHAKDQKLLAENARVSEKSIEEAQEKLGWGKS